MQMNLRAARSLRGGGESGATKQQVLLNGISEERIWKRIYHIPSLRRTFAGGQTMASLPLRPALRCALAVSRRRSSSAISS